MRRLLLLLLPLTVTLLCGCWNWSFPSALLEQDGGADLQPAADSAMDHALEGGAPDGAAPDGAAPDLASADGSPAADLALQDGPGPG